MFLGLSFRAISHIKRLIIQPLRYLSEELSDYCDNIVFDPEIICLRDLEKDLLNVPNLSTLRDLNMGLADFFLLQRLSAGRQGTKRLRTKR